MNPLNTDTSYLKIALETVMTFLVLLILTRVLGKKQLGHLTFFNYITGITIGSIAANIIMAENAPYMKGIISLTIWCALTVLIDFVGLKSSKLRILLDGEPTIIVKKGIIHKKALMITKVNLDDLTMMLRQQGVFSIMEVDYAILEPNGTLSILKKPKYQSVMKEDLQIITPKPIYIPSEIITDGKLVEKNLGELGLTKKWVNQQLMNEGIMSFEEVFYAEIQSDSALYIQKNN